jgi:hypothetical protein
MKRPLIAGLALLAALSGGQADAQAPSPGTLPGKGLSEHPFLYCGEYEFNADQQTIHLIRDGREVWSYQIKFRTMRNEKADIQELGDCTLLSNGNVIFTSRFGAAEVTPAKTIVWQYFAPDNTEVHSLQALGLNHVLLVQNGNPAKALTINKATNTVEKTFIVPVAKPNNVHGQLRRVRLTKAGTYLVAHMDMNAVTEYDEAGTVVWSVEALSPWSAIRLNNGNTLISSNKGFVREVRPDRTVAWEFDKDNAARLGYDLRNVQEVTRLDNGNTVVTNWVAGSVKPEGWSKTVQVLEITPDKQAVWALRQWSSPNLGPATSIQLLDQPGRAEEGSLQR